MLFADLLSLHLVTFLMFFILVVDLHDDYDRNKHSESASRQDSCDFLPNLKVHKDVLTTNVSFLAA